MRRVRAASEEAPGVVEAGARDALAEVEARARRGPRAPRGPGRGRRGHARAAAGPAAVAAAAAARQRAARRGLGERARRGSWAGSARLACLTLPVFGNIKRSFLFARKNTVLNTQFSIKVHWKWVSLTSSFLKGSALLCPKIGRNSYVTITGFGALSYPSTSEICVTRWSLLYGSSKGNHFFYNFEPWYLLKLHCIVSKIPFMRYSTFVVVSL